MKNDRKANSGNEQAASPSKKNDRIRKILSLTLTSAALYYACSSVVEYFRSVDRLKKADAQAARIFEELRRDQTKPLIVDEK